MRVVVDTNVVISGLFFGGVPRHVLDLVAEGAFELVLSPKILEEYHRTYDRLATGHPDLQTRHPLTALLAYAALIPDPSKEGAITRDAEDDKFLLCARATGAVVVSGDRDLLEASGWADVQVLTPRTFLDQLCAGGT